MTILLNFLRDYPWCKGISNWFLKLTGMRNNLSIILIKLQKFLLSSLRKNDIGKVNEGLGKLNEG